MNEITEDPEILDEIDQIIYIADMDTYELLFVNSKGRQIIGCGTEYYGKKCFEVLQGRSAVCPFCKNDRLSAGGETCCWDHYNEKLGAYFQLQDRQICYQGRRARIEIAIDVSEREKQQQELKNALSEQSMLTSCVRLLNGNGNLDEQISQILLTIGKYYKADRAYLFHIRADGRKLDNTYEWCADNIVPQIDFLQGVDIHYMDRWLPSFISGEAVVEPDIEHIRESYPDEYEIMSLQGIHSYMEAPLFAEEKFSGFLGVDNPDSMMIGNSSASILAMAYAISNTLVRAVTNQALKNAKLRYQTVVEGTDIGVWAYDVKNHQIKNASRKFQNVGFPEVVENVPECLFPYFRTEDREKLKSLYRGIENGKEKLEGDFWVTWGIDQPFRCEHMAYFVVKDSDGQPETAYGISIDITAQKREREQYERTLHELTSAVPNAVGVLRVNLIKNEYIADVEEENFFGIPERVGVWDSLVSRTAGQIPDETERESFRLFCSAGLLEAFRQGIRHVQRDYHFSGSDGKVHFVTTRLQMIQNPDTDEVESIVYSLDQTREMMQNEIFRIITDRSFDLAALIHLDSGLFEAVFLGGSFPEDLRALLPKSGAQCSFRDFCAEAVRHMDAETKADYESRRSPDYMKAELERSGGTYEFTLKEYFPDCRYGFMYRKFLHYRLESDPNTILVIESDETETILRQQEELKRVKDEAERDCLIMDSIMAGIAVLHMNDREHLSVDYVNSYVFQMLGYDPSGMPQRAEDAKGTIFEAMFNDALTFIHQDDRARVKEVFLANYDEKTFSLKPYRMFGNGGRCYWILERVRTGISAEGGRIFYAAFHDVSEEFELQSVVTRQLELEKQLRRKADTANAAKSDFLSRMSHDIRTPLNGIIGMTYLTQKLELPGEAQRNLDKIGTSSRFLLGLVNDILDMAKMESQKAELHPEPYPFEDFCVYLDAVIRPLCDEKQQTFLFDADPLADYTPLVDITRLNRIYFNLLSNAVKYTPEGGTVSLKIREKLLEGEKICFTFTVSDNGIGMSDEFQKHLFEPFVQENRNDNSEMRGSGLGLAIVKRIVEAMDGTISVKSEKGKGTGFTVSIVSQCVKKSALQEKKTEDIRNSAEEEEVLTGKHILLCEDHPLNQEIAKEMLTEKGMLVYIAEDGQKAVESFAKAPVGYYDCVLMDLRMPVMDGLESTRRIRAMARPDAKRIPILAMTADAFSDDVQKCLDAGMNGHIAKPIEPDQMFRALTRAIKGM